MTSRAHRRAAAAWAAHARATSRHAARELALTIAHGGPPGPPGYHLGIVLHAGETAWHRAPAHYCWRAQQTSTVHRPCLVHAGMLDWLITNQRLAARQPDGQVISIHWAAIEAITVDLGHETVTLDAAGGYHGELSGPAIAPIAVAAIATCHGPHALLDHPALQPLRTTPPN